MEVDYLILGSGLSALSFAALMAKAGKKVVVLEAHEFPGGFGHTFIEKNQKHEYHFNAQFHYVWDCGDGEPVNQVLKKLGIANKVPFVKYNEQGFDHMRIPGYSLKIPNDYGLLIERLVQLFPQHQKSIHDFLTAVQRLARLANNVRCPLGSSFIQHAIKNIKNIELL